MSTRVDPASLIAGATVVGDPGLGVTGAVIRATTAAGDHGPGFLYNDWDSAADDAKEFRGLIVTPPGAGVFAAEEDGSYSLTGAPDGTYSFTYRLFVDGVDIGLSTASVTIGALVAVTADLVQGYALRAPVTADLAQGYLLRGAVTADLAQGYVIGTGGGLIPVTADLVQGYAIRSVVLADLIQGYAIRLPVTQDLPQGYLLREAVTADLVQGYAVLPGDGGVIFLPTLPRIGIAADPRIFIVPSSAPWKAASPMHKFMNAGSELPFVLDFRADDPGPWLRPDQSLATAAWTTTSTKLTVLGQERSANEAKVMLRLAADATVGTVHEALCTFTTAPDGLRDTRRLLIEVGAR